MSSADHQQRTKQINQMSVKELGRRVRAARAYAGFTQDELAEQVQISQPTLARIEKGERQARWIEILGISAVTGLPSSWFTGDLSEAIKEHLGAEP